MPKAKPIPIWVWWLLFGSGIAAVAAGGTAAVHECPPKPECPPQLEYVIAEDCDELTGCPSCSCFRGIRNSNGIRAHTTFLVRLEDLVIHGCDNLVDNSN